MLLNTIPACSRTQTLAGDHFKELTSVSDGIITGYHWYVSSKPFPVTLFIFELNVAEKCKSIYGKSIIYLFSQVSFCFS